MQEQNKSNYSTMNSSYSELFTFDDRYVSNELRKYIHAGHKSILVESSYNTGKSHAISGLIAYDSERKNKPLSIIVIALSDLCVSSAASFQRKTDEFLEADSSGLLIKRRIIDYKTYLDQSFTDKDVDAIVTTFNSLDKVMDKAGSRAISYAVFDESEQGGKFNASNAIDYRSVAQTNCQELSRRANTVICCDAYQSGATDSFVNNYLNPDNSRTFIKLQNTYQPWNDYSYSVYESEEQGKARISDLIADNKKVFISSSSRRQCERLYTYLVNELCINGDDILCAFKSDEIVTKPEQLEQAKLNPDLFSNYKYVIASPLLATGLSIECKHFDSNVLFASHSSKTPDAVQTMQQAFRIRNLLDKHLDIVYCDSSTVGAIVKESDLKATANELLAEHQLLVKKYGLDNNLNPLFKAGNDYKLEIDKYDLHLFNNYLDTIKQVCAKQGISETKAVDYSPLLIEAIGVQTKADKAALKQASIDNVVNAKDITADEAQKLEIKKDRNTLLRDEANNLRRFNLINDYHFSSTAPTPEEIEHYIGLSERNVKNGAYNLANTMATTDQIDSYIKAKTKGTDGFEAIDATSSECIKLKRHYRLNCILADIVQLTFDKDRFFIKSTDKITLKQLKKVNQDNKSRESALSRLKKESKQFGTLFPEHKSICSLLNNKPIDGLRKLLELQFKIETKKTRGEDSFTIKDKQPAIELLNNREQAGKSSGIFNALTTLSANRKVEFISSRVKLDRDVRLFVTECIKSAHIREHSNLAANYIELALTHNRTFEANRNLAESTDN